MMILTTLLTCTLSMILIGVITAIEAFPVAGFLYTILTNLFGVIALPYWSWYLIAWGTLFICGLLFKVQTNTKE